MVVNNGIKSHHKPLDRVRCKTIFDFYLFSLEFYNIKLRQ